MNPTDRVQIPLPGLDGSNPLAFLAALGALRLLDTQRPGSCRLRWALDGLWMPVLDLPTDLLDAAPEPGIEGHSPAENALLATLARRIAERRDDAIFGLRWDEAKEGKEAKEKRNLRSPPDTWRAWARALRAEADRLSLDFVSASAAEIARDNNGKLKPTVFEFTAGQQMFLATAEELLREVTVEDLDEALIGPWRKTRTVKVLSWDATDSRDYALRAGNPSTDTKTGVPGADALALWGLTLLPVMPTAKDNRTTAAGGKWKAEWFRWGLWTGALTVDTLRSVIPLCGAGSLSPLEAQARGVAVQFEAGIGRSDQGGYGSFSPPILLG